MSYTNIIQVLKGSSTSGNFGHQGRPKMRGGSASGGGHAAIHISPDMDPKEYVPIYRSIRAAQAEKFSKPSVDTRSVSAPKIVKPHDELKLLDSWEDVPTQTDVGRKAFFIRKDGKIVPVTGETGEHAETIANYPEALGLDRKVVSDIIKSSPSGSYQDNLDLWAKATEAGNIRASVGKKDAGVDNLPLTTSNLKKLQHLIDDGKLPGGVNYNYTWTDSMGSEFNGISATYDELMNSKYVVNKGGNYELKSFDFVGLLTALR